MADIKKLEKELWEAADELRANSKLTSQQYCMPVLGLIFLRYAWGRFKRADAQIEEERAALRIFNNPALDEEGDDIIGRIYEYFLGKFAPAVASDDGIFFTPKSLVCMIMNVVEPKSGTMLEKLTSALIRLPYVSCLGVSHSLT